MSCKRSPEKLFTRLSPETSGVSFVNVIEESEKINIMNYEYTYNGGGVAAGDFNNDGLVDLYFSGNTVSNKLYLNNGQLKFEDVTEEAGVAGRTMWKTGVTTADVNGDGWLDIYLCYSGPELGQSRANQLFINNQCEPGGVPSFTDKAAEYGLDAEGTFSTQASFFDYDRDGDLDMFLINHGNHFFSPFVNTRRLRSTRHPQFGNRLFRNNSRPDNSNVFTDVSEAAGIHGGGVNFGLGVSVTDVNNDGWPDVYVTNDYEEQDFLYLNMTDGTFRDITGIALGHVSRNGMGCDAADVNNDGHTDIVEVDMWPPDNYRQKLLKGPDDYYRYTLMVDSGFHRQQMRNTQQINVGKTDEGNPVFCETGQMAGIAATDWSWAPLFLDADNDGLRDLFVTNGYLRDFTSMDFLKFTVEQERSKAKSEGREVSVYDLVRKMPSTVTSDFIFRNNGDLTFSDATVTWGLDAPNLSFGATYADLDNDGDLEIIINNTNEPATVWLNHAREQQAPNNFIQVRLKGEGGNVNAVGARVTVTTSTAELVAENFPTRGFQSSVDSRFHFGLGKERVDKISVAWPDGRISEHTDVAINQQVDLSIADAKQPEKLDVPAQRSFREITAEAGLAHAHRENAFVDFDREPLLPYQLSRLGPALACGDVNGDGVDDVFVGGSFSQAGKLWLSASNGKYVASSTQPWADFAMESNGAVFFDADGDRDLDLFVVNGGNERPQGSGDLDDRLFINDGKGKFKVALDGAVVEDHASGNCVAAADFDNDGDVDLYVGSGSVPGRFPTIGPGAVLQNNSKDGRILFQVVTNEVNRELRQPGMVMDATWTDINKDSWPDLVIAGHWMPVRIFINRQGKLTELKDSALSASNGLWNRIHPVDIDGDGDEDFVLGNAGSNLPWKVNASDPLMLYFDDFNEDGRMDPLLTYSSGRKKYPVASRDEMLLQMTHLRKKFTTYASYARATIEDILDEDQLKNAQRAIVNITQTAILVNNGSAGFEFHKLPNEAQVSAVSGIVTGDFNRDGATDLLLSGNFLPYRAEYGPSDAGIGVLLCGDGKGGWIVAGPDKTGFDASGDVRNMKIIRGQSGKFCIILVRNNDMISLFELSDTTL